MFVNKLLLEHSHAPSFHFGIVYGFFQATMAEMHSSCDRDHMTRKNLKFLPSGPCLRSLPHLTLSIRNKKEVTEVRIGQDQIYKSQ